ncbi:hypothetical protein [Patulibacter sp. SYSU D01012]|nr:hypothetical protein [Patulibacter sp. SYSU D01012]
MPPSRSPTRPRRPGAHREGMDLIAIGLAGAFFAAMLLLVDGLDKA